MTAKDEAIEIYNELSEVWWQTPIQFETGFSDVDIDMPDHIIRSVALLMINRMTHTKGSITEQYWEDVKIEIGKLPMNK